MEPRIENAYDQFLHTGRVADYLRYAQMKHAGALSAGAPHPMGGESAHHDRRDRSAGARG